MNIAILGYGTVGKGVELLAIENNINVKYILMRDIDILTKTNMTKSFKEIVLDEEVDAVVECIGGDEPSFSYACEIIKHKKHFISSNKKMLSRHYKELINMAKEYDVSILFSSACGGGIPWLNELARVNKSDLINSFKGIMNGTSNYILHKMYYEDLSFENALKKAQELGYAESDPSDDIDGIDTANKVVLSLGIGFNTCVSLNDIFIKGIRYFKDEDMKYLKSKNMKCVLLGKAIKTDKGIETYVIPSFISKDDILSSIKENNNCFILDSKNLGSLALIGQGAGSLPTASNIIRDLKMIDKPYRVEFKDNLNLDYETIRKRFYIRSNREINEDYIEEIINEKTIITKLMNINELKKIINEDDFIGEIEC